MNNELEGQQHLARAAQVKNVKRGNHLQKAVRYMTHAEKDTKMNELRRVEETLSPNNIGAPALTQEGRANLARYRNYLREDLSENVAPPISGEAKNVTLKRERELAEEIKAGLLPQEVMRRNPPGAVGQYMKAENGALKEKILEWKNLRRLNNPDDQSEDLANVELLRPSLAGRGGPSTFMADAQIPGHMAFSGVSDENWEESGLPLVNPNSPYGRKLAEESVGPPAETTEQLLAQIEELKAQLKAGNDKKEKLRQAGIKGAAIAKANREKKLARQLEKAQQQSAV